MRLLSTSSRLRPTQDVHFKEFYDDVPEYAILSHRWGNDEVAYKELRKGRAIDGAGLQKIADFCSLAASRGFEWAWIDTCCIDKRSSAELTEAINSMYRWYQDATECYVHLADIGKGSNLKFGDSEWFRRGWTLQELIAPRTMYFYDDKWQYLGDKESLASHISIETGIPLVDLAISKRLGHSEISSVATKMSWAARRRTSRAEDRAYSLMGLFGVNMPLLYGEGGERAFLRLQLEILKTTPDESIFAFEIPPDHRQVAYSMLAPSPDFFRNAWDVVCYPYGHDNGHVCPSKEWYTKDYRTLEMKILPAEMRTVEVGRFERVDFPLNCYRRDDLHVQGWRNGQVRNYEMLDHVAIQAIRYGSDGAYSRENARYHFRKHSSSFSSQSDSSTTLRLRISGEEALVDRLIRK